MSETTQPPIPNAWTYQPPKVCNKEPVKLFELKKPYYWTK